MPVCFFFEKKMIKKRFEFVLELIIKVHRIVNVCIQSLILMKFVLLIVSHFHMNIQKSIGNWLWVHVLLQLVMFFSFFLSIDREKTKKIEELSFSSSIWVKNIVSILVKKRREEQIGHVIQRKKNLVDTFIRRIEQLSTNILLKKKSSFFFLLVFYPLPFLFFLVFSL